MNWLKIFVLQLEFRTQTALQPEMLNGKMMCINLLVKIVIKKNCFN